MCIPKILKRYISLMLVIAVIMTNTTSIVFASNEGSGIFGDYLVEDIATDNNDKYIKLKITNIVTNEIEWLESYSNEDGLSYLIAHIGDKEYIVETDKEKVFITLYGEVIEEILFEDKTAEIDNLIMPYAYGAWSNPVVDYYDTNLVAGNASLIIAIVASIMGLPPAAAVVVSIGTYLASINATVMYYKSSTRYRYDWDRFLMQQEITTTVYSDSGYRNSLGSNTRTITTDMQTR